jgi:hypothetical protein
VANTGSSNSNAFELISLFVLQESQTAPQSLPEDPEELKMLTLTLAMIAGSLVHCWATEIRVSAPELLTTLAIGQALEKEHVSPIKQGEPNA